MKVYEFSEHNLRVREKLRFPWQIANIVTNEKNIFKIIACSTIDEKIAFQLICFEHGILWTIGGKGFFGAADGVITLFFTNQLPDRIRLTFSHTSYPMDTNAFDPQGEYENVPRCNFSDYWDVEKLN